MGTPSASDLRRLLEYDAETGALLWRERPTRSAFHARRANTPAFSRVNNKGYLAGAIGGRRYSAHRVAWAVYYGEWPKDQIDHINGDKQDNRITNLRDVPHAENQRNMSRSRSNKSGVTGTCFDTRTRRWAAYISRGGKHVHLGRFQTLEEAAAVRKSAEREAGYHPNHGRA